MNRTFPRALLALAALCLLAAPATRAAHKVYESGPELEFAADGQVRVAWTSADSLPPGRVVYGIQMLEDPYREPRFRFATRERGDAPRREHAATLHLARLQRPRVDAAMQGAEGGGIVRGRLELYDDRARKLEYRYFRFAYLREGGDWRRLPCIRSGPWLDRVGPDRAWVSWELDLPAEVRLRHGPVGDESAWREEVIWCPGRSEVEIDGLAPGTAYAYEVLPVDEEGRILPPRRWTFRTAPPVGEWPADGHVRVAFLGDGRGGTAGGLQAVEGTNRKLIRRLLAQAEQAGAELICFGGDLIDGYTADPAQYRDQLAAWLQAAECVGPRLPIYEGMGNHDIVCDDFSGPDEWVGSVYRDRAGEESSERIFAATFVNPENGPPAPTATPDKPFRENVYSFDFGPVHITSINSNYDASSDPARFGGYREGYVPPEQLDWLAADLAAARAAGQREFFVFTHEPAFPCGGHAGDAMYWNGQIAEQLTMRNRFWSILMAYGVRAAGFGDEHNYSLLRVDERLGDEYTTPVWQIVSGGVGAPFYARDRDVPWSRYLSRFSAVQHFCILDFSAAGARLEVYDSFGRLLDEARLD